MKTVAICDIKENFDSILTEVENGNEIVISRNYNEKPFALISPFRQNQCFGSLESAGSIKLGGDTKTSAKKLINLDAVPESRKNWLGSLESTGSVEFADDFKMTAEELVNL